MHISILTLLIESMAISFYLTTISEVEISNNNVHEIFAPHLVVQTSIDAHLTSELVQMERKATRLVARVYRVDEPILVSVRRFDANY